MGGEGIMQVAPQQDSMPSDMQAEQYRPIAENLANDPKQAIEVIVKMLMEQGIPEEEARRIKEKKRRFGWCGERRHNYKRTDKRARARTHIIQPAYRTQQGNLVLNIPVTSRGPNHSSAL